VIDHVVPEADDLRVKLRLLAPKNLPALAVHEHDVAKQGIPVGMRFKSRRDFPQHSGPVAIVRVEDGDDVSGSLACSFVHRVIMAFVLLRNPEEAGIGFEDFEGAIRRAAIHYEVLDVRVILLRDTLDRSANRVNAVKAGRDDRDFQWRRHSDR